VNIDVDQKNEMILPRSFTINREQFDLTDGSLFLVDFSGEKPTWSQVRLFLPTSLPDTSSNRGVEELASQAFSLLSSESEHVRKFLLQH
jgi:hypothetical protein